MGVSRATNQEDKTMTESTEVKDQSSALPADVQAALSSAAQSQSENEQDGTIPFISPRGKKFSIGDTKLGTSLSTVILADVFDHAWYDRKYDPGSDEVYPPACFAISQDQTTLAPHEDAPNKQSDSCSNCDKNEFGSAENGKGKACRNGRRLLIASITNGKVNFGDLAIVNISPTALKGYSKYVKSINNIKQLPVWSVATTLTFDDDAAYPIIVPIFEGMLNNDDIGLIAQRVTEFQEMVSTPYDASNYEKPDNAQATKKKSKMS